MDDAALLREFVRGGSQDAFRGLVERYTHLVYATALVCVRRGDMAEDVTQIVFWLLARRAHRIDPARLPGWLLRASYYTADKVRRAEARRRRHENLARAMTPTIQPAPDDANWSDVSPLLGACLAALGDTDRTIIALRFFEGQDPERIGLSMNLSPGAVRRRADRALAKLRRMLTRRGFVLSAAGLSAMLAAAGTQAAPPALAAAATAAATGALAGGASAAATAQGALLAMSMSKAQSVAVGVLISIVLLGGSGLLVLESMRPDVPPPQIVSIAPSPAPSSPAAEGTVASPPDGWYRTPRPPAQLLPTMLELPEVAVMTMPGPPPIEARRKAAEGPPDGRIAISSDVVCAIPLAVTAVSDTHFRLRFNREGFNNYFLFKVTGAAGKLVRFDFEQTEITRRERKWVTLNPVYSYVTDLDDPASFVSEPPADPLPPTLAWNGPFLPDTRGQKWHYVPDVWEENGHLCWVMRFEEDHAYVAMRPPYTPGYNERFLEWVARSPYAEVITVGKSREGRLLRMVKITDGATTMHEKPRRCILIYAREHATEHDSSWAAEGIVLHALSGHAGGLRSRFALLVIPLLDPDGAIKANYDDIAYRFRVGHEAPETTAYAHWFHRWIAAGNRLDTVLNLHNVESTEGPSLFCELIENYRGRQNESEQVVRYLARSVLQEGFTSEVRARRVGWMVQRLAGWLGEHYGALPFLFEFNSQAPRSHLTLDETRRLGSVLMTACADYLASPHGSLLLTQVDLARIERLRVWSDLGAPDPRENVIAFEQRAKRSIGATRSTRE